MRKAEKERLITIIIIAAIVGFIGYLIYSWYLTSQRILKVKIDGIEFGFRRDIREALKVEIENSSEIEKALWNPNLKKLTLVFVNSSDNILVKIQFFEITYKLALAYRLKDRSINITGEVIESYENLKGNETNVLIAVIPPHFTSHTKVWFKDWVVYIEGKNTKDLDLATIRFLLTVLNSTSKRKSL